MGIYVNKDSRVLIQGITGKQATFHTKISMDYGTNVVAGVKAGRAGEKVLGVPVFNCVSDAVQETGANVGMLYVPARFAADAIMEGVDAGLDFICCITEHIPVQDMIKVRRYMKERRRSSWGQTARGSSPLISAVWDCCPPIFSRRATSASSAAPAPSPMTLPIS